VRLIATGFVTTMKGAWISRLPLFVAGLLFGLGLNVVSSQDVWAMDVEILARWKTDNRDLTPFSIEGEALFLAGEKSLEAWNIDEQRLVWRQPLPGSAAFRPRLLKTIVISGGRDHLAAWNRSDGRSLWLYPKTGEIGVPLVVGDGVYFGEDSELVALDAATGQTRWRFKITGNARIHYAPASDGKLIYLGAGDGVLYALAPDSGKVVWKMDREKDWQYLRQLYLVDDMLVAGGYHDEVFGLKTGNGHQAWRFYAGNFINSQLVDKGDVYFWSPTGWLYALSARRGTRNWRYRTHDYKRRSKLNWAPLMAELKMADDRLLALDMKHVLHVLDRKDGKELAAIKLPERVRPFVGVMNDNTRLLFATTEGEVLLTRLH
jgi:outer membrane protein assembly factor BamB